MVIKTWEHRFGNEDNVMTLFPEVTGQLSQSMLRYCWALLQVFNQHFANAVPFVTQPDNLREIPEGTAIPMSIAVYMNGVKQLGISSIKSDLKSLILEQTSIEVEHHPTLYFERLRMAEAANKNEAEDAKDEVDDDEKTQKRSRRDS